MKCCNCTQLTKQQLSDVRIITLVKSFCQLCRGGWKGEDGGKDGKVLCVAVEGEHDGNIPLELFYLTGRFSFRSVPFLPSQ